MILIELPVLPYPPSINAKFGGKGKHGKFYARPALAQYKRDVASILAADGTASRIKALLSEYDFVRLVINLHRKNWITAKGKPSKTAGDWDSGIKALQDAIFKSVDADDSCVFQATVTKHLADYGFGFNFAPHVTGWIEPMPNAFEGDA